MLEVLEGTRSGQLPSGSIVPHWKQEFSVSVQCVQSESWQMQKHRVRLELRYSEHAENPVAVRLCCGQQPAESSSHQEAGQATVETEVAAVTKSLLDAVCGCEPPLPSAGGLLLSSMGELERVPFVFNFSLPWHA